MLRRVGKTTLAPRHSYSCLGYQSSLDEGGFVFRSPLSLSLSWIPLGLVKEDPWVMLPLSRALLPVVE